MWGQQCQTSIPLALFDITDSNFPFWRYTLTDEFLFIHLSLMPVTTYLHPYPFSWCPSCRPRSNSSPTRGSWQSDNTSWSAQAVAILPVYLLIVPTSLSKFLHLRYKHLFILVLGNIFIVPNPSHFWHLGTGPSFVVRTVLYNIGRSSASHPLTTTASRNFHPRWQPSLQMFIYPREQNHLC